MGDTTTQPPRPRVRPPRREDNVYAMAAIGGLALKDAGYERAQVNEFYREITAAVGYDAAMAVMKKWCDVE